MSRHRCLELGVNLYEFRHHVSEQPGTGNKPSMTFPAKFLGTNQGGFHHFWSSIGSDRSLPIGFLGEVDPDAPQTNASGSFQIRIGRHKTRQKTSCLIEGLNQAKTHQKVILVVQPDKESLQVLLRSVVDPHMMGPCETRLSQLDSVKTKTGEILAETAPPITAPVLRGTPLNPG